MELSAITKQLTDHALSFHGVLVAAQLYRRATSQEAFLSVAQHEIAECAKAIQAHQQTLAFKLLTLPTNLVHALSDVLCFIIWDYEFGYVSLFQELDKLFQDRQERFVWSYDAKRRSLRYAVNAETWLLEDLDIEVNPDIATDIIDHLSAALAQRDHMLYEPVTGDQTAMLMIIPTHYHDALRQYLIAVDDPRARQMYED